MRSRSLTLCAVPLLTVWSGFVAGDWLDYAREGYIEHHIERHSHRSFCDTVAYAGASAANARDRGIPLDVAMQDALQGHDYANPVIDWAPYVEHAVTAAYQSQRSPEETHILLASGCSGGQDLFAEPYRAYREGLIEPSPSDSDVRQFVCQRGYGPKAAMLYHQLYQFGASVPQLMERSITTSPIMTRQMQRGLVQHLASEHPPSSEAAQASVIADCMEGKGIFATQ